MRAAPVAQERSSPAAVPSIVHAVPRSPGRPLDSDSPADTEPRFSHDFSRVRIHDGAMAHGSAPVVLRQALPIPSPVPLIGPQIGELIGPHLDPLADPLKFAESIEQTFPGWRELLPDCPCTDAEAKADTGTWTGGEAGALVKIFHPGAKTEYRSVKGYPNPSVPGTSHGQQCCYDSAGKLATDGPAAGTPDIFSPVTDVGKHQVYDVQTWLRLDWQTYNKYWKPNQGAGDCPPNYVDRPNDVDRPQSRCTPTYLGYGEYLGEDCIVRVGPGPKY